MRLIDADALSNRGEILYIHTTSGKVIPVMAVSVWAINNTHTIDAVPVVHAMWTEDGFCSACGNEAGYTEWIEKTFDYDWDENLIESGEEVHRDHKRTEYCSRCGAKMDGEVE